MLFYPIILLGKPENYDSILAAAHKEVKSDRFDSKKVERLLRLSNTLTNVNLTEAVRVGEAALKLSKQMNYISGEIGALCKLGTLYSLNQQYGACLKSFAKAIKLAKETMPAKLPDAYNDYGNVLSYIGNYREAAENYYKAVEAISQLDNPKQSQGKLLKIYYNLYSMWRYLGNYEQGMDYLDKAEKIALIKKDSSMLSRVYAMKGTEYLQANPEEAKGYLYQALDIENSRKQIESDIDNRTVIFTYLAYYYINMQKEDSAEYYIDKILRHFPELQNPYAKIICLLSIGEMHWWMQHYDTATRYFHKGLQDANQLSMQFYIQRTYQSLSLLYQETKNFDSAYYYQQKSYEIKNELTNESQIKEISFLEHQHQFLQSERQLAEEELRNAGIQRRINQRNAGIGLTSIGLVGMLGLYFAVRQHRKRRLSLQHAQISALVREMDLQRLETEFASREAERKRLAMELHDGVGSLLYVARLNINTLFRQAINERDSPPKDVDGLVNETIGDLRKLSHSLFPEMLLQNGLEAAFTAIWKQQLLTGVLQLQTYGTVWRASAVWEKTIFRIFSQLMEPVFQHSTETPHLLQLNWHPDMLWVTVELQGYRPDVDSDSWKAIIRLLSQFEGKVELDHAEIDRSTLDFEFPYPSGVVESVS